jgi:hypothetical protein
LPKAGFKSITVSETVYDKFHEIYQKSKDDLTMKGVNSFAGYVTYMLEEMMQRTRPLQDMLQRLKRFQLMMIVLF